MRRSDRPKSQASFVQTYVRRPIKTAEWSDEEMVPLRNLSGLEKLALSSSRVTRAGLAHLKGLTNLRRLNREQIHRLWR